MNFHVITTCQGLTRWDIFKILYRTHLEYCVQAWSPYHQYDIQQLENVQRRATKLVKGFHRINYKKRVNLNFIR